MSEILFECFIQVSRHSSKKNEKVGFRNARTGKMFIGKSSKAKACEDWLLQKLNVERLKKRVEPIYGDLRAEYTFYFPRSVYFTKNGDRSRRLPDLSNLLELPSDCLQKVRILSNDTQIVSFDGSRRCPIDGNNYYLKIVIYRAEDFADGDEIAS